MKGDPTFLVSLRDSLSLCVPRTLCLIPYDSQTGRITSLRPMCVLFSFGGRWLAISFLVH